jgi:hypothetical protein
VRRAHQHPRTWKVTIGQGEDAQNVVLELPDRDLAFSPLNADLLGAALQRAAKHHSVAIAGESAAWLVHLLRRDLSLACGTDGKVRSSGVPSEVTCTACKNAGPALAGAVMPKDGAL